jgi:hypothetical protein
MGGIIFGVAGHNLEILSSTYLSITLLILHILSDDAQKELGSSSGADHGDCTALYSKVLFFAT